MNDFAQVWRIGRLTFLEAVRQRLFGFLVVLSVALIGSSVYFRQFDFGDSELKFIADFGQGGIFFFGAILAVVATAQLFFSEMDNRTALTLLAKPVRRWAFIAGKFCGVALVLLVFVALLTALLAAYLAWREGQLRERMGQSFYEGNAVQYGGLAVYGALQWVKFGVLAAITLLVASFSNTNLYTVVVSFFLLLICQLQYIARDTWEKIESPARQALAWLVGLLVPNFQLFNIGSLLIFPRDDPVPTLDVLAAFGYGALYIVVFLALAVFSFRRREF